MTTEETVGNSAQEKGILHANLGGNAVDNVKAQDVLSYSLYTTADQSDALQGYTAYWEEAYNYPGSYESYDSYGYYGPYTYN